jgi:hypothetical protein
MQAFCARCVEERETRLHWVKGWNRPYWFCRECRTDPKRGSPSTLTTVCSSQNRPPLLEELERRMK